MSDQAEPGARDVSAAIDRLHRAVQHLEAALATHERTMAEATTRMQTEAEGLRALQQTVAVRLDAAIARLKDAIGD